MRKGIDGGESVILDSVDPDDIANRFDRVFIGSGDCAFAWLAYELVDRGVEVVLVARDRSSLSKRLRWAPDEIRFLFDNALAEAGPMPHGRSAA